MSEVAARHPSPFLKQCFVTLGVTLNSMQQALLNSFSSVLVPQLRSTGLIELDDETASWIASIHNISMIVGVLIVPSIMGRYGRKVANCLTAAVLCLSWFAISMCTELYSILIIKLIQGLCSGMIAIFAPVTIGEYTSPKYRGAFLTTISLSYSFGTLMLHGLGAVLTWQNTARVFGVITFLDCLIILNSPESPSFLASRRRFAECKKAFQWLREPEEDGAMEKLILIYSNQVGIRKRKTQNYTNEIRRKILCFASMLKKPEFYKPIILMFHLHLINEWSGATVIDAYTTDIYQRIVGADVNMSMLIISTDVQRIITNSISVVIIKKYRRRLMLLCTTSLNILVYLLTAGYVFAKTGCGLFEDSIIGVVLIHLHIFSIASGCLPLPNIISGEIFALEYRGLSSMIAFLFFVVNVVINSKTVLLLFSTIGLYGTYCVYAGFVAYGLVVSWIMLPETKDKTLLDIEEKFRGTPLVAERFVEPVEFCLLPMTADKACVK